MKKKLPTWAALCAVCLCAVAVLFGVNRLTADGIARQEAALDAAPRSAALASAEHFEARELQESRYSLDALYAGLDAAGDVVGYVGQTMVSGYGGPVEVVAGLDDEGVITGVSVGGVDFAETPGLGALTREAAFTDQFKGKTPVITLNEDGVDTVSGASTTSRAVVSGVNAVANYVRIYALGIDQEEVRVYTGPTSSATAQGFAGDVTATVGFAEDGTIEYLAIDTPDETDGLGKLASESAFTSQFIGKSGPFAYGEDGIEAVTGATYTSTAALEAINAVVSGGGSESAEPVSTTVQGFGGEVTVTVRLNPDNTVAALAIDTPDETDGLGKLASESAFTSQFIGKAAPFAYGEDGIDAVTGATVTSTAVLDALNAIVPAGDKAAGASEEQTEVETEAPVEAADEAAPAFAEVAAEREAVEAAGEDVPEEALDDSPAEDADRLMRPRPVIEVVEDTAPAEASDGDVARFMRPRPVIDAEQAEDTIPAPDSDVSRLMRPRPELEPAANDTETDYSRFMRSRPVLG